MSKAETIRRKQARKAKQTQEKLWEKYMTGFYSSAYHQKVANEKKAA